MSESIQSFAKINLFLYVTGRRPDGFHELFTLFAPIDLADTVTITPSAATTITCTDKTIPTDERNLVMKADTALRAAHPFDERFAVHIKKNIPAGGGLGGGSSNAAAYVKLVNRAANLKLDRDAMASVLASIGSDTAFFLFDAPMIGTGRGEILVPAPKLPECYVLIANPGIESSTPAAYRGLNLALTTPRDVTRMTPVFDFGILVDSLHNDLEPPVFAIHPVIGELKGVMHDVGAPGALMSGSGSTVFGLFQSAEERDAAAERLAARQPGYLIRTARVIHQGAM